MSETPDELRARLQGLREALTPAIVWAATTTADCLGESDNDPDFPDVDWCLYDAEEDDPPLASGMMRQHAIALAEFVNAWPAIDALLARLTAAEADADRLAEQMRDTVEEFYGEDGCTYNPNEAECLRLHDEALALRDPS